MLYARYAKTRIPYYAEGWDILSRPFQNRDTVPPSIAFQAAEKGQDMPRSYFFQRCRMQWSKLGGVEGSDAVGSLDVVDFWNNTAAS
jgi:hypothetical protein